MPTESEFNESIAAALCRDDDDEDIKNYMVSEFGRYFSGYEVDTDEALTICPFCESHSDTIAKRRINAAYADDEKNWMLSCKDCFDRRQDELAELWDDYYSMAI